MKGYKHKRKRLYGKGNTEAERFWSRVAVTADANRCWEWLASTSPAGYGQLVFRGKLHRAHRVAFLLHNGSFPAAENYCCHKCDNPLCVNPHHLFEGTPKENIYDCRDKGRAKWARGSAAGSAILKEADIPVIRKLLAEGNGPTVIANRYGVSHDCIAGIKHGRNWRHIQ